MAHSQMPFNQFNGFNTMTPLTGMPGKNDGREMAGMMSPNPQPYMPMTEMGMNPMLNPMMMQQYHHHQMMMMSMAMNPYATMWGNFNPMMNPATMQQQQQWMNAQTQLQMRTAQQAQHVDPIEVNKDEPESEGEIGNSDESAVDSDSDSPKNNRMGLSPSIPPTPEAPTRPVVAAKRIRSEMDVEYHPMDVEFRNPNAVSKMKTTTDEAEKKQTEHTVGKMNDETDQSGIDDIYTVKLKDYRAKASFKKNHIWSKLATEEVIEETAKQFDVVTVTDTFSILRGSETYVVGAKRKRKLPMDGNGAANPVVNEKMDDYMSDSSVSSGGLSDNSKTSVRKHKAASRQASIRRKMGKAKSHTINPNEVEANTESAMDSEAVPVNGKLETDANDDLEMINIEKPKALPVWKYDFEEKIKGMEDYQVAHAITARLKERKKLLMLKIMKSLGREQCKHLFYKTLKIERLGGLRIKNGKRRRTAGGVFIHLVRNDPRIPEETKDEIFKEERELQREQKRKSTAKNKAKWENNIQQKLAKGFSNVKIAETKEEKAAPEAVDSDAEADDIENSYDLPEPVTAPLSKPDKPETCQVPVAQRGVAPPQRNLVLYDDMEHFFEAYCYEKFGPSKGSVAVDQEPGAEEAEKLQDVPVVAGNLP